MAGSPGYTAAQDKVLSDIGSGRGVSSADERAAVHSVSHVPRPAGAGKAHGTCANNPNAAWSATNYSVPLAQAAVGYGVSEGVGNAPGNSAMWAHGGGLAVGILVNYLAMTEMAFYTTPGKSTLGQTLSAQRRAWTANQPTSMCVGGMNLGPVFVGIDNVLQSATAGIIMYLLTHNTKHALYAAGGGAVGGVGLGSYYNRKN